MTKYENVVDGYGRPVGQAVEELAEKEDLRKETLELLSKIRTGEKYNVSDFSPEAYDMAVGVNRRLAMEAVNRGKGRGHEKGQLVELDAELKPIHDPVQIRLKKGLTNIPGMEYLQPQQKERYQKPYSQLIHFSPEVRDRLREKYQEYKRLEGSPVKEDQRRFEELQREIFDQHPVYSRYKTMEEQAQTNIAFWLEWLGIAKSITEWHKADLENKTDKLPAFVKDDLKKENEYNKTKERIVIGDIEPAKPGLFNRVKDKRLEDKEKLSSETFIPAAPEWIHEDNDGVMYASEKDKKEAEKHNKLFSWLDKL